MTDLITRLRTWSYARDAAPVSDLLDEAANEIEKLREQLLAAYRLGVSHREAICRLADQDATLSVQGGNVIVTMDATLTDAEREALEWFTHGDSPFPEEASRMATVRGLLERTK